MINKNNRQNNNKKAQVSQSKNSSNEDDELDEQEMANAQTQQTQQIIETGAVTTTKGKYVIHCLTIVGQIEGHYILPQQNKTTKYEHVIPQLVAIQENPEIQGLLVILNTVGGDVEAGLAISELLSGLNKPTVSLVLGGGHSIGVPLAVSTQKSFIVPSATMTIHPVRMNGVMLGVPQTLSYFDKMQERIVHFVEENSNIPREDFQKLMMNTQELVMDVGTVLNGAQAVECGLIDEIGGLSNAMECLYSMIEDDIAKKSGASKPAKKSAVAVRHAKPHTSYSPTVVHIRHHGVRYGAAATHSAGYSPQNAYAKGKAESIHSNNTTTTSHKNVEVPSFPAPLNMGGEDSLAYTLGHTDPASH